MTGTTLPFGKHKGQRLSEVPLDYLLWCLGNLGSLSAWLRLEMQREVRRRGGAETRSGPPPKAAEPPPSSGGAVLGRRELEEAVRSWYRRLAMKFHPDRGGTKEAMQAIADAKEMLCQSLGLTV